MSPLHLLLDALLRGRPLRLPLEHFEVSHLPQVGEGQGRRSWHVRNGRFPPIFRPACDDVHEPTRAPDAHAVRVVPCRVPEHRLEAHCIRWAIPTRSPPEHALVADVVDVQPIPVPARRDQPRIHTRARKHPAKNGQNPDLSQRLLENADDVAGQTAGQGPQLRITQPPNRGWRRLPELARVENLLGGHRPCAGGGTRERSDSLPSPHAMGLEKGANWTRGELFQHDLIAQLPPFRRIPRLGHELYAPELGSRFPLQRHQCHEVGLPFRDHARDGRGFEEAGERVCRIWRRFRGILLRLVDVHELVKNRGARLARAQLRVDVDPIVSRRVDAADADFVAIVLDEGFVDAVRHEARSQREGPLDPRQTSLVWRLDGIQLLVHPIGRHAQYRQPLGPNRESQLRERVHVLGPNCPRHDIGRGSNGFPHHVWSGVRCTAPDDSRQHPRQTALARHALQRRATNASRS